MYALKLPQVFRRGGSLPLSEKVKPLPKRKTSPTVPTRPDPSSSRPDPTPSSTANDVVNLPYLHGIDLLDEKAILGVVRVLVQDIRPPKGEFENSLLTFARGESLLNVGTRDDHKAAPSSNVIDVLLDWGDEANPDLFGRYYADLPYVPVTPKGHAVMSKTDLDKAIASSPVSVYRKAVAAKKKQKAEADAAVYYQDALNTQARIMRGEDVQHTPQTRQAMANSVVVVPFDAKGFPGVLYGQPDIEKTRPYMQRTTQNIGFWKSDNGKVRRVHFDGTLARTYDPTIKRGRDSDDGEIIADIAEGETIGGRAFTD